MQVPISLWLLSLEQFSDESFHQSVKGFGTLSLSSLSSGVSPLNTTDNPSSFFKMDRY
jgi:hypothetical protein